MGSVSRSSSTASISCYHAPPASLLYAVVLSVDRAQLWVDVEVAPGMGAELKVKVLCGSLLEETMSRRQLHEAERRAANFQGCWRAVLTRDATSVRTP